MCFKRRNGAKVSALTMANYLLERAKALGYTVSLSKLNSLLYYVQGAFLANYDRPAFWNGLSAWPSGPVVPPVFYHFSKTHSRSLAPDERADMRRFTRNELELIDRVLLEKGDYADTYLAAMTRREAPWLIASNYGLVFEQAEITRPAMRDYFSSEI
mgnify:FL=1